LELRHEEHHRRNNDSNAHQDKYRWINQVPKNRGAAIGLVLKKTTKFYEDLFKKRSAFTGSNHRHMNRWKRARNILHRIRKALAFGNPLSDNGHRRSESSVCSASPKQFQCAEDRHACLEKVAKLTVRSGESPHRNTAGSKSNSRSFLNLNREETSALQIHDYRIARRTFDAPFDSSAILFTC
jgi:hypothetical protein